MQFQMTNELFYTRVLKQARNNLSLHLKIQSKFGTLQPFDVCTVNHQWIDTYTINIWASGHFENYYYVWSQQCFPLCE